MSVTSNLRKIRPSTPREWISAYGLIAPTFLFLVLFFLLPVTCLLFTSFSEPDRHLSLANYSRLIRAGVYVHVIETTIMLAFWTTLLCVALGYPVAYFLSRANYGLKKLFLFGVLVPFWTSYLVRTLAWLVILGRQGALNQLLIRIGITTRPLEFLYSTTSVLVGLVHALLPLCILVLLPSMKAIDERLMSAASSLGARRAYAFWCIYFPLSLPGVVAAASLVFVSALGVFITPQLMGGRGQTMIAQLIISEVEETVDWPFAAAIAVVLMVVTGVLLLVLDRFAGISLFPGAREARKVKVSASGSALRSAGYALLAGIAWLSSLVETVLAGMNGRRFSSRGWILPSCVTLIVLFLILPALFLIPLSFTTSNFLQWPPVGFSPKWYMEIWASAVWRQAAWRSVLVGLLTAALSVSVGAPAAIFLVRRTGGLRSVAVGAVFAPVVTPHIIAALSLYYVFSYAGLVGNTLGLVLGHLTFVLPYAIISMMAVVSTYDVRLDQAAWTLGAGRFRAFFRITAPIILPGIVAAFLLSFVRSFDELTVSLFLTGGTFATLPKQIWEDSLFLLTPSLAAVSTMMMLSVAVLLVVATVISRPADTNL